MLANFHQVFDIELKPWKNLLLVNPAQIIKKKNNKIKNSAKHK